MIRTELMAPISVLLARHAKARPQAVAFEDATRGVTYAALAERSAGIAVWLAGQGVEPGARVAIHQPNSVDWVELALGVHRAGAIAVPISFGATADEIAYRLEDGGCAVVLTRPDMQADIAALCRERRLQPLIVGFGHGGGAPLPEDASRDGWMATGVPRDPQDMFLPGFIVYTSGTTGRAKGVVLSVHGLLWVTASCWAPIAGIGPDDVVLNALPLFHSYALSLAVVTILATGAREYIMDGFSTTQVAALLEERSFTVLPGVPTVFHYLLDSARRQGRRSLGAVRVCVSAGAILPGPLNEEFEAWFGLKLLDGYGITETSTMVTMNWPTGGRRMGSCGLPVPGLAVRILGSGGQDTEFGEVGELIVRGPNVMLGYHSNAQATEAVLRGGWYHTGDLATMDRCGFLTITGRLKEIIIRGGQNISPAEVEEAIFSHPAVLDCAVVAARHAFLGEVPVAFVILRPEHDAGAAGIIAHCKVLLSAYKLPDSIHFIDEIPRTGSGKVQRFKLRALIEPD